MINRVTAIMSQNYNLETKSKVNRTAKAKPSNTDNSGNVKSDIPSKLFSFTEGISKKDYDSIVSVFNLNANQVTFRSDTFAIYDISKYKGEFPFELQNPQIISHQSYGKESMVFTMKFSTKENPLPTIVEVELNAPYENVELLDESTFKNTVLKAMIVATEKIKLDQSMGHKVPNKYSISLDFNKANKTVNFNELKDYLVDSYGFLIEKKYSDEMLNKYQGHYDLNIDPNLVRASQLKLSKIIDEVIKDLL